MELLLVIQQTDAAVAAGLDRIATMLTIIAVSGVVVGLFAVVSLVASLFALRSATRVLGTLERQVERLSPRVEPLIEKVTGLAVDLRDSSGAVRRRVNELMDTVADVNRGLKQASQAAEVRVREFAAVLDVVKSEAEELLIDGAATARGLHAASEVLRRPAPAKAVPAPAPPEEEEVAS
jgi:uncharacterized protein YoxC